MFESIKVDKLTRFQDKAGKVFVLISGAYGNKSALYAYVDGEFTLNDLPSKTSVPEGDDTNMPHTHYTPVDDGQLYAYVDSDGNVWISGNATPEVTKVDVCGLGGDEVCGMVPYLDGQFCVYSEQRVLVVDKAGELKGTIDLKADQTIKSVTALPDGRLVVGCENLFMSGSLLENDTGLAYSKSAATSSWSAYGDSDDDSDEVDTYLAVIEIHTSAPNGETAAPADPVQICGHKQALVSVIGLADQRVASIAGQGDNSLIISNTTSSAQELKVSVPTAGQLMAIAQLAGGDIVVADNKGCLWQYNLAGVLVSSLSEQPVGGPMCGLPDGSLLVANMGLGLKHYSQAELASTPAMAGKGSGEGGSGEPPPVPSNDLGLVPAPATGAGAAAGAGAGAGSGGGVTPSPR